MTDRTLHKPTTPGVWARVKSRMPARRKVLKWVHLFMIPLLIWFIFVTPEVVVPFGPRAFQFHSTLALVFVVISIAWAIDLWVRGLASRPGPKLKGWKRTFHQILHKTIIIGLFGVAITGFLLGLTSARLLKAGGFLPIAPPLDMREANDIIGQIHIYEFYILAGIVIVHALFHIWRHFILRDNVLRIMAPKWLHKWL